MHTRNLSTSPQIPSEFITPATRPTGDGKTLHPPTRSEYLRKHMHRVPGYLRDPDAAVIAALLAWQEKIGMFGHLCEIGVHHGRLFLLLALSRQANERSLAIDLFEDDEINQGVHSGRKGGLFRQTSRLDIDLSPAEILKGSSLELTADEILSRTGGPVRFFSVDGGHMFHHVENDLKLAHACLAANGVIAADDFFYIKWPEVSFAVFDFLRATPDVVPVFATNRKLYIARRDFAPLLMDFVRNHLPAGIIMEYPTEMLGSEIAILRLPLIARVKQELKARLAR